MTDVNQADLAELAQIMNRADRVTMTATTLTLACKTLADADRAFALFQKQNRAPQRLDARRITCRVNVDRPKACELCAGNGFEYNEDGLEVPCPVCHVTKVGRS